MSSWNNKGIANANGGAKNPAGVDNAAPMKKTVKAGSRKTAKRAIKRGMISEKAAKKHLGDY